MFSMTATDLMGLTYEVAVAHGIKKFSNVKKSAGKKWYYNCMCRHPDLSLRSPEPASLARAAGFNREAVYNFFDLLDKLIDEHNFTPAKIYNVDETWHSTVETTSKVLSTKGKHQVGVTTSAECGSTTTGVYCHSGQGLEEKRGETGDQEASLEEAEEKEKEKSVGEKTRENSSTDNKDGKRIRPGAQMIATHDYKKNPESPVVGNELDVNEGDTLVYLMTNENNEHWWLAEDGKGQVGYVPATYLKIIRDVTRQEEESDTAGKEGYGKKTDGSKIGGDMGQDGERRKTYSAAVIEGFKRNSAIYVGDSIVRKTDSRLNKGEDVVVCLPGARIEHVTARVEKIMGRGKGGTILVHIGTNNADKEGTTAIVDKYSKLLKKTKEARVGQIILSGILPVFGNRIDGYRNSKRMAINGMVKRLCKEEDVGYVDLWDSFVGKEEMYLRDGLHLSGKGAAVFAEGLSGAVASGLGKVRYLN